VAHVDLLHGDARLQHERLRELLAADRAEHRLDRAPAIRVEGAAEVGDADAGEAPQQPVDHAARERAPGRVAARHAPARGDVRPLERGEQLRDVLRLVLQVAVHRHDRVAARAHEAGVHRRVLAEVALEAHDVHPRVGVVQFPQPREGRVRRAVVDEDRLPVAAVERLGEPPVELRHRAFLVQHRDHNRYVHLTRP